MSTPRIRPAAPRDLPELVRIYNHYVTATHVTFDTEPFTVAQRRPWFERFAATGPYRLLVAQAAEAGSRVLGYASSQALRPKPAYRPSVETTVYVDPDRTGRGIGRVLYAALIEALVAEAGVHRAYAAIVLPNPASIALHESAGFTLVGTLREVGWKFDRYWDVSWYERDVAGERA